MNRCISFIVLIVGVSSAMYQRVAFSDVLADGQNSEVSMIITKFHVNDQNLELSWKIVNNTDHDVWICDSVNTDGVRDFEVFMAEDNHTLVVRRRFDLNPDQAGFERFFKGRYIRFGPGQDRTESLSFTIPPPRQTWFEGETGYAPYAKRLAIEIGYYNEDLRELLVNIINVGKKLDCDSDIFFSSFEEELAYYQFFGGFVIAEVFKSSDPSPRGSPVYDPVYDGGEEISMYHMGYVHMGEKVLRATINDVSIPCHLDPQSEPKQTGVTMALTGFDINDTNLELSWKIINNTDHDVWICDKYVDTFMDTDNRTLILRTRYNLSKDGVLWEFPFPRFRYSRLYPGQEKVKSYSLDVPVRPDALFETSRGNAEYAERLAVEIGYYDEDLSALFIDIAEMAEKLNCDSSTIPPTDLMRFSITDRLFHRFFGGVEIAIFFNSESFTYFRDSVTAGGDEIIAPYLFQTLNGEQVLRLEVDNVSIPYESNYPPLNNLRKEN